MLETFTIVALAIAGTIFAIRGFGVAYMSVVLFEQTGVICSKVFVVSVVYIVISVLCLLAVVILA